VRFGAPLTNRKTNLAALPAVLAVAAVGLVAAPPDQSIAAGPMKESMETLQSMSASPGSPFQISARSRQPH
jgi:hypothetical protein